MELLSILIPVRSESLIRMSRIISIRATNYVQVIIGLRKLNIASAKIDVPSLSCLRFLSNAMVQSVNRDRGTKVELRRDPCAAAGRCSRKDERKAEKVGQFWRASEITLRDITHERSLPHT